MESYEYNVEVSLNKTPDMDETDELLKGIKN